MEGITDWKNTSSDSRETVKQIQSHKNQRSLLTPSLKPFPLLLSLGFNECERQEDNMR